MKIDAARQQLLITKRNRELTDVRFREVVAHHVRRERAYWISWRPQQRRGAAAITALAVELARSARPASTSARHRRSTSCPKAEICSVANS
jgi:hypothetical protein